MAKSKKNNKQTSSKRSVRVQDLRPKKNPKGGATIKMGSTYLSNK
jgi:hypothetical protein